MGGTRRAVVADMLTRDEENELTALWQTSQDAGALAKLVGANLKLVYHHAKQFHLKDAAREDLIQEGVVGLLEAARRFDPSKGARFGTYATFWIRAHMLDNYRVDAHVGKSTRSRAAYFAILRAKRNRTDWSVAGIAEATGASVEAVEHIALRMEVRDVSLDKPRSTENGTLGDGYGLLSDKAPGAEDTFAELEEIDERRKILRRALERLTVRERQIIERRHLVEQPHALRAIGKDLGISHERVRQIQGVAEAKIKRFVAREALQ